MTDDAKAVAIEASRETLLQRHAAARQRRDRAPLGSAEHQRAITEIGEIEVEINSLDVASSEGRVVPPAHPGVHHS